MGYVNTEKTIAMPVSVAAGAATEVRQFDGFTVYVASMGTATYQLQISVDGSTWVDEGSAVTAAGVVNVTKRAFWVRWNCTAWTSGTPTATIAGYWH